jgi:DNA-binding MarR family transcriptional regulator
MPEKPAGGRKRSSGAVAMRPMRRIPHVRYGMLDDLLGYALRRAQNAIYLDFSDSVGDADVTPQRFAALVLVCENAPFAQTTFADAMGVDRSVAARLIDWLAARGWVERERHSEDSRQWLLQPTAAGLREREAIGERVLAHDRRIASALGEGADLVRAALDTLAAAGRSGRRE